MSHPHRKVNALCRVIIAGGRDFEDYDYLASVCHTLLNINTAHVYEFVSGNASGADALGERYAKEYWPRNRQHIRPADWAKHGKRAGYLRNEDMATHSDVLIAFWDGKSKGTLHMITLALKHGLEVHVYPY